MIYSFEPIRDSKCTVLVLGTMPGAESLRQQQYYAYGKNQFWRVISDLTGIEVYRNNDYEARKAVLLEHHIALWDVLRSCVRENSSDSKIRTPEPNDFLELLFELPELRHICFNGKEAEKLFHRLVIHHIDTAAYTFTVFPSTSPANTVSYDKKLEQWCKLQALMMEQEPKV